MASVAVCQKPGCEAATTGRCALGNDPIESCTEYADVEDDLDRGRDVEPTGELERSTRNARRLRSSELLARGDLWPIQKSAPTNMVSLVGDVRSGKTTLIAALYASFCKGPFAGFDFRSSQTLTAFARRHHRALEQSKRSLPTTPRTSRQDGVGFFHLNVDSSGLERQLLIADRSGEDFRDARRHTDLIPTLWELAAADRVSFVLDAGRLANPELRAGYKREFKQQIWALLGNDAVRPNAALEIVSTKLDKLAPRGTSQPVFDELDEFEAATVAEFAAAGHVVETRRVCALPRSNFAVGVIGLDELLQGWLKHMSVDDVRPLPALAPARWIDRMFAG